MKISVGCVAGDSGDETVLAEQFLEVLGSLRQPFRRKAHVLGYERRALRTVFADESKQSFAYVPRQLDGFRHARELYRMDQIRFRGKLDDLVLQNLERSHVFGAELHEKRRGLWIECSPISRGLREGLAGGDESRRDHQFDRSGSETDEARDKTDRFVDCRDRYPGDAGYAGERNGVDHRLGDECQCSLGSHEETAKDFERRLAVQQGAEPIAMGVPYRVLSSHAVDQLPIGEQFSA